MKKKSNFKEKMAEVEALQAKETKKKDAHGIKCPRCGSNEITTN